MDILVITVVLAALVFDFCNGWNDSANAIATVVSTKVLSPVAAIALAALLNFAGAFAGQAVAKTIATGIIDNDLYLAAPPATAQVLVLAAVLAASVWVAGVTRFGMPVSGSHSLIGGMLGAGLAWQGGAAIEMAGITKVIAALLLSPFFGILLGYLMMLSILWMCRRWTVQLVQRLFGRAQVLSVSWMAFEHGHNDAQKAMGVITLALLAGGWQSDAEVQWWVILLCGFMMAAGTAAGGWRVIKTVGTGLLKLRPVQGFAAETSASIVLLTAASQGLPVSTTHTITSSIMGVGATQRLSAVRWGVGAKIIWAWLFTFPATIAVSWILFSVLNPLLGTV